MHSRAATRIDQPVVSDHGRRWDDAVRDLDDAVATLDRARCSRRPGPPSGLEQALDAVGRSLATCFAVGVEACFADPADPRVQAAD